MIDDIASGPTSAAEDRNTRSVACPTPAVGRGKHNLNKIEHAQNARAREGATDDLPEFLRRYLPEVVEFWKAWPTSDQSPEEISAAWPRSNPPAIADMLAALDAYKADIGAQNATRPKDNQRQWMQATNWLRKRCWEGYVARAKAAAQAASVAIGSPPWDGHPVAAALRREIGEKNFDFWLRPCRLGFEGGAPVLHAPTRLIRDKAAGFIDEIERALGSSVRIEIDQSMKV